MTQVDTTVLIWFALSWLIETLILCIVVNRYILRGKEIKRLQQSVSEMLKTRTKNPGIRIVTDQMLMDSIRAADCDTCFFRNHDFYHEEPCKTCTDPDDDKRRNMYDGTHLPDHSGSFKRW